MITILLLLYAALAGDIEAMIYDGNRAECFIRNEHKDYTYQRVVVFFLALASATYGFLISEQQMLLVPLAGELVAAALCFPLVHDEVYNFCRLWLKWARALRTTNPVALHVVDSLSFHYAWQEYRFGYQSKTTTAVVDLPGPARLALAVAGGVVYLATWAWLLVK
ncbi:hypothetical protein HER32_06635 [Hymenobacter sp. BT18]|uniref:hypothetical protein n=1 Tax=Hymenobacter sp. BT18 TaxID=2835648 RepID=UPI00143E8506|nr:hypothetical protein [Hymenobacter sp. BT18]QIX60869.1 hypothetical protein HER32_06635 [Hymenobacter sp. BT18]